MTVTNMACKVLGMKAQNGLGKTVLATAEWWSAERSAPVHKPLELLDLVPIPISLYTLSTFLRVT